MRQRKPPRSHSDLPAGPRRASTGDPAATRSHSAPLPPECRDGEWIYGRHASLAAIGNPQRRLHRIVVASEHAPLVSAALTARRMTPLAGKAGELPLPRPESTDTRTIASLLPTGAVHQGFAVLSAPLPALHIDDLMAGLADSGEAVLVVLDQATDPRNVGAVLRAAAAFGVAGVLVQDRHAPTSTGALAKAASGALEAVPLVRVTNIARTLRALQDAGFWCTGFAGNGAVPIDAAALGRRVALVLGSEGDGLRRLVREACDELVHIPIATAVESLNLATASAIALYEVRRRHGWPDRPAVAVATSGEMTKADR